MLKFGFTVRFLSRLLSSVMAVSACTKSLRHVWEGPCWEGMWLLDPRDVFGMRSVWTVPKMYGPYGELFFFIRKEEPTIYEKVVGF